MATKSNGRVLDELTAKFICQKGGGKKTTEKFWRDCTWQVLDVQGHLVVVERKDKLVTSFCYGWNSWQDEPSARASVGKEKYSQFEDENIKETKETVDLFDGKNVGRFVGHDKPEAFLIVYHGHEERAYLQFAPKCLVDTKNEELIYQWIREYPERCRIVYLTPQEKKEIKAPYVEVLKDTKKTLHYLLEALRQHET